MILLLGSCALYAQLPKALPPSNSNNGAEVLYLITADIERDTSDNQPVHLYRVGDNGKISEAAKVALPLTLKSAAARLNGVYSIHEVGKYIVVEYPHQNPTTVVFISKMDPADRDSIVFNPDGMTVNTLYHTLMETQDGTHM